MDIDMRFSVPRRGGMLRCKPNTDKDLEESAFIFDLETLAHNALLAISSTSFVSYRMALLIESWRVPQTPVGELDVIDSS